LISSAVVSASVLFLTIPFCPDYLFSLYIKPRHSWDDFITKTIFLIGFYEFL